MKESTPLQLISAYIAHALTVPAMVLTVVWAGKHETSKGFLGGLSYSGSSVEQFNYHPVYMVASMIVIYANALLCWRTLPIPHPNIKALHALLQTAAIVLMGLGLKQAFHYSNRSDSENLYTLHGWLGLLTVSLFCSNYLGGLLIFANPYMYPWVKGAYLPIHQYLGLITFVFSASQVFTGIQEENIWYSACSYDVDRNEIDPAFFYDKLTNGCKVSNGLGIVVLVLTMTTLYATTDLQIGRPPSSTSEGKKYDEIDAEEEDEATRPLQTDFLMSWGSSNDDEVL